MTHSIRVRLNFTTAMLIALAALALSLMTSCQSAPKRRQPVKSAPSVEKEFQQAKALLTKGDTARGIGQLKKITTQFADSDLADDAHMLLGQTYERQQQWSEALQNYMAVVHSDIASPLEADALLRAARVNLRFSKFKDVNALTSMVHRSTSATELQKADADELRGEALLAENRVLDALEVYVGLAEKAPDERRKDRYKLAAQDLLDTRLSEEDIERVADRGSYGFLRPTAKYRIGLIYADQRKLSRARSAFQDIVALVPGSELAERATVLITQIDARSRVNSRTVGVVLPLSGRQQAIGYRALRGLQLGLGIYGRPGQRPSGFRLAVVDSEGNPDIARRGLERLVVEDNAIAVVGGMLSRTATAEADKAQEFGVPAIMMSQRAGLTDTGDFIFRNALTSQMQAERLAAVSIENLGLKRFAILFPNDPYGTEFANFFWDAVRLKGGEVTAAQVYDPKETDFRSHVQRLVGKYYIEDRAEEYRLRHRLDQDKNPRRSARQGRVSPEELLPPIVDFDALFIPDSARAAGQIAPMLAYNDVSNLRLLGPNLWNNQNFVTRGQKFVENAVIVDGLYTGDRSFQASEFVKLYRDVFGEEPGMIEAQAYDSGLLLRQLISSGASSRVGLQERLASVKDFPGAFGPLDMAANRELQRPISVLTVKDAKLVPFEGPVHGK
ncbi:MAG: penicillin-binding protein activator [Bdellovibrionales bacterium]|jgi:ABC-type branched-subunit amino acid transport system substrate-binding protein/predicted negative regulator of RcsB-dependent stress response|nr:penicillin-binding protein activator [Bdellovibrionales bacterium]